MQLSENVRRVVGTVAPGLASALVSPLAGVAVRQVAKALDMPEADAAAMERRLTAPEPAELVALQAADREFQAQMRSLGVELERIEAGDRADARAMQVQTRDWTPAILAAAYSVAFFAVIAAVLRWGLPADTAGDVVLVLIGALAARTEAIMVYYFGSSRGSKEKSDQLALLMRQRQGPSPLPFPSESVRAG